MIGPPVTPTPDDGSHDALRQAVVEATQLLESQTAADEAHDRRDARNPRSPARSWRVITVIGVAAMALAGVKLAHQIGRARGPLPAELRGRWATDAPRFDGRELILTSDSVFFQVSRDAPPEGYRITTYHAAILGQAATYDIEYRTPEGPLGLSVVAVPQGLRLSHRDGVLWTRRGASR